VPSFTEVSTPELQSLFTTIRENLFLPAHLSDSQRLLIEKSIYHKQLQAEPYVATISGEDFTLKPLPIHERPNAQVVLAEALNLMREKKDWDNIPNLLRGIKIATGSGFSERRRHQMMLQVVTRLGRVGHQEVLLECVRRGADTGITLSSRDFATHVISNIARKASDNDFNALDTRRALLWAEQAVDLMEKPEHAGSTSLAGEDDPRISPEIMGIMLQLAAVRVSKHLEGKDTERKVASYTEKLLNTPIPLRQLPDSEDGYVLNPWMWTHVPVLHGMNLAQSLQPGSKYAEQLRSKAYTLSEQVSECRDRLEQWQAIEEASQKDIEANQNPGQRRKNGGRLYSLKLYDKMIGTESI
jgi:hypothetical protein